MEFDDNEANLFEEIMEVLGRHPDFKKCRLGKEPVLHLPELAIYPDSKGV